VRLLFLAVLCAVTACGETPAQVGVLRNTVNLQKTDAGPSPSDLPFRQFRSPSSPVRIAKADLLGDEDIEVVVELPKGLGVAISDSNGRTIREIRTPQYLTYFGVVESPQGGAKNLVLYTYPNANRGGTFQVLTPDNVTVARWEETPPPSHFDSARWQNETALFYLRRDEVIVRSLKGAMVARLPAPSGVAFQQVHVANMAGGRTVLIASGNGYTPFHMVCVYESDGRLIFQEIGREHAFGIETPQDPFAFTVLTRSRKWRYATS
jgi:hypothetical protein